MCYFMFGITEAELEATAIEENDKKGLFIRDESEAVTDKRPLNHYYHISNGHCACEIVVSPYAKIDEMRKLLKGLSSKGSFRFVIIDSECEDNLLQSGENANFEALLKDMPQESITVNELSSKYPGWIEFDKVYMVE